MSCFSTVRRGAGVLRHNAGRDRGLLLRGLQGPQEGERRATHGRQAGMIMQWALKSRVKES